MTQNTLTLNDKRTNLVPSTTMMVLLFIATIVMVFAGLTSAVIVKKGEGDWLLFDVPTIFQMSTALIVLSSVALQFGFKYTKRAGSKLPSLTLIVTTLLGIGFMISQFIGWSHLVDNGIFLGGKYSNAAGSFMYVLTILHWVHILAGVIYLLIVTVLVSRGKDSEKRIRTYRNCAIFWHFLGGLWLYLYIFLILNYG